MKKEEPKKEYAYLPSNPPQRANVHEKREQPKPDIKKEVKVIDSSKYAPKKPIEKNEEKPKNPSSRAPQFKPP